MPDTTTDDPVPGLDRSAVAAVLHRRIWVTWAQVNFHRWPNATGARTYLAEQHRHRFEYRVTMDVRHNDREVEFHDLLTIARSAAPQPDADLGANSCEDMATTVLSHLLDRYPGRRIEVEVSEDGEVGAQICVLGRAPEDGF